MMAPNMAKPTRNSRPVATLKTGLLHSRRGMIGSLARPSTTKHVASLARRDDVADDRLGGCHQPARADTLEGAESDEHPHRLRHTAEHRPREEDDDRRLEDALATVEVADLSVKGHRDRRHQDVGGDDP